MQQEQSFEVRWAALELQLKERFGKLPNMEALLYLIGINEFNGRTPKYKFSKEEKQDLMHVAVCTLLSQAGYYQRLGSDEEGWPHFAELKPVESDTLEGQEHILKEQILVYFAQ